MLVMTMKRLQTNLKFLGYYNGKVNGVKGNLTKEAIRKFRNDNGLGNSDVADQKMIDCIRNIICDIQRKVGATVDGVAGNETATKKAEYEKNQAKQITWDNIKHFKKEEFTCKCGCGMNNIDLNLVKILDEIREYFGQPVVVSSGCRCKNHNAKVGGVQGSRHVQGKAADIIVRNVSKDKVLAKCKKYVANGRARYTYTNNSNMNKAVHIDIL